VGSSAAADAYSILHNHSLLIVIYDTKQAEKQKE